MKVSTSEARKLGLTPARKRTKATRGPSVLTAVFIAGCRKHGLPEPVTEHKFCERRWKFDYAWFWRDIRLGPGIGVALECDGGAWTQGRHTRGQGFIDDMTKLNRATIMGWRVLRCVPADIESGTIFALLKEIL